MEYRKNYEDWLNASYFDDKTKEELLSIKNDEKEIQERFYKQLDFGTAGLRGIIGAGTNRMNIYTVRRATCGVINYLLDTIGDVAKSKGVVIAHDCRYMSREFCIETATTFAAYGIKAYIFDELRTTPELSFAVRNLNCAAGIVITASHNPKEYNGYKVYNDDGGQIGIDMAKAIINEVNKIEDMSTIKTISLKEAKENNLVIELSKDIDKKFIDVVQKQIIRPEIIKEYGKDLKIIFTPINGTGNKPVREALKVAGFENVSVVKEQENPDPAFSTVKYPNPEEKEVFNIAIEMAKKDGADLIIGTDPDCDRVGVVVKNNKNEYIVLSGNQTGALLVRYILEGLVEKNKLPKNPTIIKTIVTSELGANIANHYGVECLNTLTGFKFIGEKIREYEQIASETRRNFIMGYEESFGYLIGTHARDKDAVVASLMICEMAAYYKSKELSLYDARIDTYEKLGYYKEFLKSITLSGMDGLAKIKELMEYFTNAQITNIGDINVAQILDYKKGIDNLPTADVLKFMLEDGSWIAIRPSGTEPKIKFYFGCNAESERQVDEKINKLVEAIESMIEDQI